MNAVAALCVLAAVPCFIGMRWKRLVDRNNLVGAFLLGLALFLHGGFETLLRSSPVASFEGAITEPSWAGDDQAEVWLSHPHGSTSPHLHVRWSADNEWPPWLWDTPLKCRYRVWDLEITHVAPVEMHVARAWDSGSGGRLWCALEGICGLALGLLSAATFRRAGCRAPMARWVKAVCLAFLLLVGGWAAYVALSDWLFERKAEALLRQIQGLELRKSTWKDADSIRRAFAGDIQVESPCSASHCDFSVVLNQSSLGNLADGTLSEMLRLAGRRRGRVVARVRVRNGIVWGKSFVVMAEMPDRAFHGCAFVVDADTVRGFYWRRPPDHLNIEFGAPGGCECCIARWVHVTPYASPEEMREAFAFDLSCLGPRLRACVDVRRFRPTAARHFEEETAAYDPYKPLKWSPEVYQRFGRDSENAAVVVVRGAAGEYQVTEMLQGTMTAPPRLGGGSLPVSGEKAILFWDHHSGRVVAPFSEQGVQAVRAGIAEAAADPL